MTSRYGVSHRGRTLLCVPVRDETVLSVQRGVRLLGRRNTVSGLQIEEGAVVVVDK